jgi:hypothetical protein
MMRQLAVLMWKEWRQTRVLFLTLAVGGPLFVVAATLHAAGDHAPAELSYAAVAAVAVVAAVILPCPAFAGERRTRCLDFTLRQPIGRWMLVLMKCLVPLAAWIGVALVAYATHAVLTSHLNPRDFDSDFAEGTFVLACLLFSATFLASAVARRPATAALVGTFVGSALALVLRAPAIYRRGTTLVAASWSVCMLGMAWATIESSITGWGGKGRDTVPPASPEKRPVTEEELR